MRVKKLKELLTDLPDDMPVLVPTGMDWGFLVEGRVCGLIDKGRYLTSCAEGVSKALFLAPYESQAPYLDEPA